MRRRDSLSHLPVEALLDGELASLALGVSVGDATQWLTARGRGDGARTIALDRRASAWRALCERLTPRPAGRPRVDSVEAAVALISPRLAHLEVEELHVLGLDPRNRVLGTARIARGAVNQVLVTAREVFRPLVELGAARAIIAHNHPSGDATPSEADHELTARLGVAGELLGIVLVDHLVIAAGAYHSFARSDGLIRSKSFRPRRRGNVGQGIGIG